MKSYKGFYSLYLWFALANLTITWFYLKSRFSCHGFVLLFLFFSLSPKVHLLWRIYGRFRPCCIARVNHHKTQICCLCLKRVKTEWCINLLCPPNTLSHTYVNASTKRNGNHKCAYFLWNLFLFMYFLLRLQIKCIFRLQQIILIIKYSA